MTRKPRRLFPKEIRLPPVFVSTITEIPILGVEYGEVSSDSDAVQFLPKQQISKSLVVPNTSPRGRLAAASRRRMNTRGCVCRGSCRFIFIAILFSVCILTVFNGCSGGTPLSSVPSSVVPPAAPPPLPPPSPAPSYTASAATLIQRHILSRIVSTSVRQRALRLGTYRPMQLPVDAMPSAQLAGTPVFARGWGRSHRTQLLSLRRVPQRILD